MSDWASNGRPLLQTMGADGCERTKVVKTGGHDDIIRHRTKETMEYIPGPCHEAPHCPAPACPTPCPPRHVPVCAPACPAPCPPPCPPKCVDPCDPCAGSGWGGHLGALFVWWLIIFAITWFVLYLLKPTWVLKDGGHPYPHPHEEGAEGHPKPPAPGREPCVDNGKVLLWALVISFLIVLLVWLFKSACSW